MSGLRHLHPDQGWTVVVVVVVVVVAKQGQEQQMPRSQKGCTLLV
jgi:hypothetical protein